MRFFITPVRRLCLVRACSFFVLALGLGVFSFAPEVDEFGRNFCYAGAGVCVLVTLFNLWKARRTPAEATITTVPDLAPVPEQIQFFRRMLWSSAIAFPVLTVWVAYELHQLESGAEKEVTIFAPLVPVYEHFGYWPAVILSPILGAVCCAVFIHKLRQLANRDNQAKSGKTAP
jgi:hypothetical protein